MFFTHLFIQLLKETLFLPLY